jgi:hypothetical protein
MTRCDTRWNTHTRVTQPPIKHMATRGLRRDGCCRAWAAGPVLNAAGLQGRCFQKQTQGIRHSAAIMARGTHSHICAEDVQKMWTPKHATVTAENGRVTWSSAGPDQPGRGTASVLHETFNSSPRPCILSHMVNRVLVRTCSAYCFIIKERLTHQMHASCPGQPRAEHLLIPGLGQRPPNTYEVSRRRHFLEYASCAAILEMTGEKSQ